MIVQGKTWFLKGFLLVLFLFYWAVCFWNLDRFPRIHYDEPAIAAPGYKWFQDGVFGSDMFTGFYGQEQHYLETPPLMSLLQGLSLSLLGVGVWQMRYAPAVLGLLTLALTYRLGKRLAGKLNRAVGVLAVLILLFWQWTPGGDAFLGSGIPLLDVSRIARYDILVPSLGMGALLLSLRARDTQAARFDWLSGLLAGLAGLANVYGLFWVVVLLTLTWLDGQWFARRPYIGRLARVGLAAAGPWLLWSVIIALHWSDFLGQSSKHAGRFDFLSLSFYLGSLQNEVHRYALGFRDPGSLTRLGFWLAVLGVPAALLWLAWRVVRRRDTYALSLLIPCLLIPALFALFVNVKRFYYLMTLIPLLAITLAWGLVAWWQWRRQRYRPRLQMDLAIQWTMGLVALLVVQGVMGMARMERMAMETASPAAFFTELRQVLPPDGRILGPPQYWLGLSQRDYRSIGLAFLLSGQPQGKLYTFGEALDYIAPDVFLLHPSVTSGIATTEHFDDRPRSEQFQEFMQSHQARLLAELTDYEGQFVQVWVLEQE